MIHDHEKPIFGKGIDPWLFVVIFSLLFLVALYYG